jgi:hypothetical protein
MSVRRTAWTLLAALPLWACARPHEVDVGPPGPLVTSDPSGVEILLDGRPVGRKTPSRLESWESILSHEIELDLPGRVPFRQEIPPGNPPAEVHARLPPAAFVDIASEPPGAAISIAGVSFATAPAKLAVPAGEPQSLSLSLDGFLEAKTNITSPEGETAQWHMALQKAGVADFQSDPQGAQVVVDGVAAGKTPVQLSVTVGKSHHAQLELRGLSPCDRTFKVTWKAVESVSCDLDDAVGRTLKAKLQATEAQLKYARKRLEGYDAPQGSYEKAMAADRARGKLEDQIQRLTDSEDKQQGDLEAHRTELEERFEHAAPKPEP